MTHSFAGRDRDLRSVGVEPRRRGIRRSIRMNGARTVSSPSVGTVACGVADVPQAPLITPPGERAATCSRAETLLIVRVDFAGHRPVPSISEVVLPVDWWAVEEVLPPAFIVLNTSMACLGPLGRLSSGTLCETPRGRVFLLLWGGQC
jgi:hypothetical protein